MLGEDGIESLTFEPAIAAEAVEIKDDGQGDAGVALNLLIEFDEGDAKNLREEASERGFAGATKSNEGDAETAGGKGMFSVCFEKKPLVNSQIAGSKAF